MITVTSRSAHPDPLAALSEALWQAGKELMGAGGSPATMRRMLWTAPEPAAVSPHRRAVDLVLREAFGGFRSPITVSAGRDVSVTIEADRAQAPDPAPVWQGLTRADLAREYSPRSQVPDLAAVFRDWTKDGAAFLAGRRATDIAYGKLRDETFDLFMPERVQRPPVWVFIHGGYWQATDKDQYAQFARGMLAAGFAVANVNYTLAPTATLAGITKQIAAALTFLARSGAELGVDGARLHVCGHSAGGHLAAYATIDPACPPLTSSLPLSGLMDLRPVSLLPMGPVLGLTNPSLIKRLSPIRHGKPRCRVALSVGGAESAQFKWQSAALAEAWGLSPPLHVPGANHFSLLDGLNGGPLLELAQSVAKG
jgi:arylformamidase